MGFIAFDTKRVVCPALLSVIFYILIVTISSMMMVKSARAVGTIPVAASALYEANLQLFSDAQSACTLMWNQDYNDPVNNYNHTYGWYAGMTFLGFFPTDPLQNCHMTASYVGPYQPYPWEFTYIPYGTIEPTSDGILITFGCSTSYNLDSVTNSCVLPPNTVDKNKVLGPCPVRVSAKRSRALNAVVFQVNTRQMSLNTNLRQEI